MKRFHALLCILLAASSFSLACTCAPPPPDARTPREAAEWKIKNAEVIFEGRVDKITIVGWPPKPEPGRKMSLQPSVAVTFADVRLYHGQARQFTVETGWGNGDCGYNFIQGHSYLVYAQSIRDGLLSTGICSGTSELKYAGPALRLLRNEPPTLSDLEDRKESGNSQTIDGTHQICGKISFPKGVRPLPLRVYIWPDAEGGEREIREVSTANGSFCEEGVVEGKYFVAAVEDEPSHPGFRYAAYYPGVLDHSKAKPVVIENNQHTGEASFAVYREPLHTVRGYLRGVPESENDNIKITLLSTNMDPLHNAEFADLGPHGMFEIQYVPDGVYSAFAATGEGEDPICVSEVLELHFSNAVENIKLQFVPPQ